MTTDNPPTEHRLRNATRRPVELHLDETTLVLQPGDIVTVAVDEPYSSALLRRGVLTRQASPAAAPPAEQATRRTEKKSAIKRPASTVQDHASAAATAEKDPPVGASDSTALTSDEPAEPTDPTDPSKATDNLSGADS